MWVITCRYKNTQIFLTKWYSTVEGSLGPPVGSSKETLGKVEEKFQVQFHQKILVPFSLENSKSPFHENIDDIKVTYGKKHIRIDLVKL